MIERNLIVDDLQTINYNVNLGCISFPLLLLLSQSFNYNTNNVVLIIINDCISLTNILIISTIYFSNSNKHLFKSILTKFEFFYLLLNILVSAFFRTSSNISDSHDSGSLFILDSILWSVI